MCFIGTRRRRAAVIVLRARTSKRSIDMRKSWRNARGSAI
jgi:hypothetical protein